MKYISFSNLCFLQEAIMFFHHVPDLLNFSQICLDSRGDCFAGLSGNMAESKWKVLSSVQCHCAGLVSLVTWQNPSASCCPVFSATVLVRYHCAGLVSLVTWRNPSRSCCPVFSATVLVWSLWQHGRIKVEAVVQCLVPLCWSGLSGNMAESEWKLLSSV